MRLIVPSKLQLKKLKEIVLKLFIEYKYVFISHTGTISLYKSFWHLLILTNKKVNITDMCVIYIPERLGQLKDKTFGDKDLIYQEPYNEYSHNIIELMYRRSSLIIDYLYDEYILIKHKIRKVYCVKPVIVPTKLYVLPPILFGCINHYCLMLSALSRACVKQSIKYWKEAPFVFNHAKILSNYLNLWFKREVKERLEQYYQLQVSIA